ncbi:hypothetical protein D3C86_1706720 [compost metagenome]
MVLDGPTGTGSIVSTPVNNIMVNNIMVNNMQILAKTEVKNNIPIVYYTGAAWDKAGKITNAKQWQNYLNNFYQQIKEPLIVNLK